MPADTTKHPPIFIEYLSLKQKRLLFIVATR